ncbi:MAG: hypothetical protein JZD41_05975 [Thermoproteus sp.]|nr:hypothetical protein [Thermoproteus sp.]
MFSPGFNVIGVVELNLLIAEDTADANDEALEPIKNNAKAAAINAAPINITTRDSRM